MSYGLLCLLRHLHNFVEETPYLCSLVFVFFVLCINLCSDFVHSLQKKLRTWLLSKLYFSGICTWRVSGPEVGLGEMEWEERHKWQKGGWWCWWWWSSSSSGRWLMMKAASHICTTTMNLLPPFWFCIAKTPFQIFLYSHCIYSRLSWVPSTSVMTLLFSSPNAVFFSFPLIKRHLLVLYSSIRCHNLDCNTFMDVVCVTLVWTARFVHTI